MKEIQLRNQAEFNTNQDSEKDFHKIYEDSNEEEFFFCSKFSLKETDLHKELV